MRRASGGAWPSLRPDALDCTCPYRWLEVGEQPPAEVVPPPPRSGGGAVADGRVRELPGSERSPALQIAGEPDPVLLDLGAQGPVATAAEFKVVVDDRLVTEQTVHPANVRTRGRNRLTSMGRVADGRTAGGDVHPLGMMFPGTGPTIVPGMHLQLGVLVHCADAPFGELSDIVVDPVSRHVTHLVVRPHGLDDVARLVPIDLLQAPAGDTRELSLRCTVEDVHRLDYVQEYVTLDEGGPPLDDPEWDPGIETVLSAPEYGGGMLGDGSGGFDNGAMIYDRVPKGDVEIAKSSAVVAADGDFLGRVDGLVIDPDGAIAQFVLERGHFWWRRAVTVPIDAVARVDSSTLTLTLSEAEFGSLPSVSLRRWF